MTRSYPKPIREVFQDLEEKLGWTPRLDSIKRLGSETASSAQRSTSNERGTAEPRPSGSSASQLVTTETISADSPLRRPATVDELEGMILKLGLTTGHVVERHRAALIADALLHAGWTSAEVEAAYRTIVGSAKLMKEISFERTIGPGVFAQAREAPSVRRCRLFEHDEALRMAGEAKQALGQMFEAVRAAEDNRVLWRVRPDHSQTP